MVGVKWAVPKNNGWWFYWRKGVQRIKECVQHRMKTTKETAKNEVVDFRFLESYLLFFFSIKQPSGFLLTLSTSSMSFILSVVCMTMATGEIYRQLWQQLPHREKHLELQQLRTSQGNKVKHGVSVSAKTSGQRPWKCTCAWWRCVNTHPTPTTTLPLPCQAWLVHLNSPLYVKLKALCTKVFP